MTISAHDNSLAELLREIAMTAEKRIAVPAIAALTPPDAGIASRPPLTAREKLYASGNRKRENLAPKAADARPRSRLYRREGTS